MTLNSWSYYFYPINSELTVGATMLSFQGHPRIQKTLSYPLHTQRGETSLTPLPGYEWCVFRWARPSPLCILRSFLRPHCLWTTVISLLITLLLRLCIRMSHHYSGQWSSEAVAISEVDSLGHFLGHSINFLLVWTRGHAWMVHHSLQVNWCVLKQCMVQSRCLVTG